ncbi:dihydrolipoyl dehydrogenase [Lysobacter sp. A03]|uniref:dihydrolipoyl dehydrogenase n=1 Tax=Lysobacter sp. A03 TaxID=1199154 RepID=UPI0005B69D13|nr:dihydrolipoyl dehydrogenase [Lysobacter sp. A03]KIQ96229.1 Dihydrolipoamide dehydrogenase [Lysobacter sp. A03]
MTRRVRIAILGAGTAGLTALKEAQRYTDDVLLINQGPYGTTCARVGCMPSKALIEVAHTYARKDWLSTVGIDGTKVLKPDLRAVMAHVRELRDRFTAGSIEIADDLGDRSIHGKPRFLDPQTLEVNGEKIHAEVVIIATGTRPIVPEAWREVGDRLVTSDDVFEMVAPGQRLGVVGLGPIGVELAQAFAHLECEVHGFTKGGAIAGLKDPEVNASLVTALGRQMSITTNVEVSIRRDDAGVVIDDGSHSVVVDWVLAAIGRQPNIEGLGLDQLGVELDERGMPEFDAKTLRVGDLPIYLAGDVNGQRPLLHEAADEGRIAAYHALHPEAECLMRRTPLGIVFTEPGAGQAGVSYSELPESGVVVGRIDYGRQGRAVMAGRNAGLLHLYVDEADGRILGAEAVAPDAEHLLHLLAWAIQQEMTVDTMLHLPFYHPTVEEGLRTALQSARRALSKRREQPDLPLCRPAIDWALG